MLRKELQTQGDAASDATADADEEVLTSSHPARDLRLLLSNSLHESAVPSKIMTWNQSTYDTPC